MAPIQTKTMSDLDDGQKNELNPMLAAELQREAEAAALMRYDRAASVEASHYSEAPSRVVSSHTAGGEPISARDFFSSDRTYELTQEAAREQVEQAKEIAGTRENEQREQASALRNIGRRLAALRDGA